MINNQNVPKREIISSTGIIQINATFSSGVDVCNCRWNGISAYGFIRVTIIPALGNQCAIRYLQ